MHPSVMTWVASIADRDGLRERKNILEIGSYNVNGSVRDLFPKHLHYTGIDVVPGPGVDMVTPDMGSFPDGWTNSFDLIVSTEALEHDGRFWRTLSEVRRVATLTPVPARIVLTMRGMKIQAPNNGQGMPYHGSAHFKDVYRFLPDSIPFLAELCGMKVIEWHEDPQIPGLFIYGEMIDSSLP